MFLVHRVLMTVSHVKNDVGASFSSSDVLLLLWFSSLPAAGGWRAAAQPHGADGENTDQEQEETPQGRRKHQEEALRAGLQHLQRLVQRVRAVLSERRYARRHGFS